MKLMKKILLPGLLLFTVFIFIPLAGMLLSVVKLSFHLDFAQGYRRIENVENIVFWNNWDKQPYMRAFWGLEKAGGQNEFPGQDPEERDRLIEELEELIPCENAIDLAVLSPDEKYILYREIIYNYKKSDMTDDEYCYYRIYDRETGEVTTVYRGYREWFDIAWT